MSTFKDCITEIRAATGDLLSEQQADELLQRVHDRAKQRLAEGKLDNIEQTLTEDAMKFADEEAIKAFVQKKQAAINMVVEKKVLDHIAPIKDKGEGLWAYMVGGIKRAAGMRDSIDYRGKAVMAGLVADFRDSIRTKENWSLFASGTIDREIARELFELGKPDGKPGITGNMSAREIAEGIHQVEGYLVDRTNRAGAFIRKLSGYIVRQSHDPVAIRQAGYEAWRDFILPKLDHEKTFFEAGVKDPEKFLRSTYDALQSGVHLEAPGGAAADELSQGFVGPGNMGKRLSQSRRLHFKDADAWMDYNESFGTRNLREAFLRGTELSSRNIALMEGFGTNPHSMFERIRKKLIEQNRDDPKVVASLRAKRLDWAMAELDGTTKTPDNISQARFFGGWRATQSMAKLGTATISSLSDAATTAIELGRHGHNPFKAFHETFIGLLRGRGSEEIQDIARHTVAAFDGLLGEVHSRFSSEDNIPGALSKLQQKFFSLNGMNWWNDSIRTAGARVFSTDLAKQAGKTFDNLEPKTRDLLKLYNIDAERWDLYRQTAWTGKDGNSYITPDRVRDLEPSIVRESLVRTGKTVTDNNVLRYLDDLETSLRAYFIDRAEFAVPTPGAAEKVYMNYGTQPGTVIGDSLRLLMQFKGFPITSIRKGLGAVMFDKGAETLIQAMRGGRGEYLALAHYIFALSAFGYISMVAKDILKGKSPRELFDDKYVPNKDTIMAALTQGGGFGIMGDFMFGKFNREGRSASATLMGPTFGQVDDIVDIYQRMRDGEDVKATAFRKILGNVPYINLFYLRTILDYLIVYNLQESMNPGYLRRLERRTEREQQQRFFLPPSSVIPSGGDLSDPFVGAKGAIKEMTR